MRSIAIVGGGHAGLQLGIGLRRCGYEVTIVTDRTPEDVRTGKIMSSQGMQRTALQYERDLGLAYWDDVAPKHDFIEFSLGGANKSRDVYWRASVPSPGNSVCQRVKIPRWSEEFQKLEGVLEIRPAGIADLEAFTERYDLVIVATGKGDIGKLFERDASRSQFDKPMRALALTYVAGMDQTKPNRGVSFSAMPEVGEYFVMPAVTTTGDCEIMVFEGLPGGPMDCWSDVKTPAEHLKRSREILERFFPWEAARCRHIELTDANGTLVGRFPPAVRKPVASLPSGRIVLGIADVVMLNDPLTGQGANNASKFARHYLDRIVSRGSAPFNRAWMEEVFESYWQARGKRTVEWSNIMLLPPSEHMQAIVHAAEQQPAIAKHFVECFDDPPRFFDWLFERKAAEDLFGPFDQQAGSAAAVHKHGHA
jgi:2-polyprenyl-6-methoxyphenol hydroxylase-like FAD-dependent oxidoreductase